MTAAQFDAEIYDGVLTLPAGMKDEFEGQVHVILVKDDSGAGDDLIAELLATPVKVPGFAPLSRDEAHDRGH
jgi:hypothetical protein